MKLTKITKTVLVFFIHITITIVHGQTPLIIGLDNPKDIVYFDNAIYCLEGTNTISKVNLIGTPKITKIIKLDSDVISSIAINNSMLYFSRGEEDNYNTISSIDLKDPTPVLKNVYNFSKISIERIAVAGDILFFYEGENGTISKMNVKDKPIKPSIIVNDISEPILTTKDNYLYFDDGLELNLFRLDYTKEKIVSEKMMSFASETFFYGFHIKGDYLYGTNLEDNDIIRINIDKKPHKTQVFIEPLVEPYGITSHEDNLYFTDRDFGILFKANLNNVLSIEKNNAQKKIYKLFPNPSKDYIKITTTKNNEKYTIYNYKGKKIISGKYSKRNGINISSLQNGLFLVHLSKTNQIFKFTKQ